MNAPGRSLRETARDLQERAARAGMEHPARLAELSPREIELEFRALAARRQREAELADLQAWLIGRYVLLALYAPRRFPRRPDAIVRKSETMADADMKRVFSAMAARREEEHGDC